METLLNQVNSLCLLGQKNSLTAQLVYCFATTTNWGEWLEIKENLAFEIKGIVEKNDAGFAFPSQSIYIEKGTN